TSRCPGAADRPPGRSPPTGTSPGRGRPPPGPVPATPPEQPVHLAEQFHDLRRPRLGRAVPSRRLGRRTRLGGLCFSYHVSPSLLGCRFSSASSETTRAGPGRAGRQAVSSCLV